MTSKPFAVSLHSWIFWMLSTTGWWIILQVTHIAVSCHLNSSSRTCYGQTCSCSTAKIL